MVVTEKYVIRNDNRRLSKVTTSPKKNLSRQSCINNMALKLLQYLYCWWRSCLVVIYKFYLLSIRLHSATNIRKHPFLYPQGESLRINFDHIYHQRSPSQVAPWCSGYHYCTTSFNQAWIQVQILFAVYRRFAMVKISDNGPRWKYS